jgi:general secretion pathway protein I
MSARIGGRIMRTRSGRRLRGFTLIEVLVALAIVVVGVAALLSTLSSAANTTAYLRDKTFAQWIGFNQIALARLALQVPADGTTNGDVDYAGRKWHYEQTIEDLQFPGMRRIDVKVVLLEEGKTPSKDLWTATVSSILGASVASPNGILPDWDDGVFQGRPAAGQPGGTTTTSTPNTSTPNGTVTSGTGSVGGSPAPATTPAPAPAPTATNNAGPS